MKVVWLTRYGSEGASTRYRTMQYLPALAAAGIDAEVDPLAAWGAPVQHQLRGAARRVRRLRSIGRTDADVIVIQKEPVMPPALWPLVRGGLGARRRRRPPVVWDVDDAVWIGRTGARPMAEAMARSVDVVVAGNSSIGRWASKAGARRVELVPTCFTPAATVPPDHADVRTPDDGPIEVLWIGSPASVRLLDASAERLRALFTGSGARLTVMGGEPTADFGPLEIQVVPWSPTAEHEHLLRADYGLGLQPRTEYADHKCGFKLVQYLAYGVIPIATDSPVHRELLGDVGFLVDDAASVARARDAITRHPRPDERAGAHLRWETTCATAVGAERWREILDSVGHR
jgi:glycosyltransferase involved in cell wall biosynthesis